MSKYLGWSKVFFAAMLLVTSAQGASKSNEAGKTGMKGLTIGGNAEAGYMNAWIPSGNPGAANGSQWGVDNLTLKTTAEVSDKTKFVWDNQFSLVTNPAVTTVTSSAALGLNSNSLYSKFAIASGTGGFTMAIANAYLDHQFAEGVHLAVGEFRTPYGMESLWDRYDLASYYYSAGFIAAHANGWDYDVGARLTLTDILPGSFELAVVDDRTAGANVSPGVVARWWYEWKSGDLSITPVVSGLFNKWRGGPADLGFTAGAMVKSGAAFLNAEFVYDSTKPDPTLDPKTKVWSLDGEPGIDLGVVAVSAKIDYYNTTAAGAASGNSNFSLGGALSHTYAEKYRVRVTYEHMNFSNDATHLAAGQVPVNDFRVLFGTSW